mgnify:CR=1 FL=1
MGTLYIVGTPIGNLGDFSPRAIEILKTVDFIAAEDTRVTLKLLNHFEIRNTLISYHEHNAAARGPELLERLLNGENGAIVTDAGMPCISDPGEGLVALCHENEVEIATVPWPPAACPPASSSLRAFCPSKRGSVTLPCKRSAACRIPSSSTRPPTACARPLPPCWMGWGIGPSPCAGS